MYFRAIKYKVVTFILAIFLNSFIQPTAYEINCYFLFHMFYSMQDIWSTESYNNHPVIREIYAGDKAK